MLFTATAELGEDERRKARGHHPKCSIARAGSEAGNMFIPIKAWRLEVGGIQIWPRVDFLGLQCLQDFTWTF